MIQYKSQYEGRLELFERRSLMERNSSFLRSKILQHTVNQWYVQPLSILAYLQATLSLVDFMRFSEGVLSRKYIIQVLKRKTMKTLHLCSIVLLGNDKTFLYRYFLLLPKRFLQGIVG